MTLSEEEKRIRKLEEEIIFWEDHLKRRMGVAD